MEIQVDIRPTGIESAIVYAPFDKGKEALESKGYRIISLEENARLRMQQGKNRNVSKNGNWTREEVVYLPDKRIILTRNSSIMQKPKEATDAHRNGNEFYPTEEQIEQALTDYVILSGKNIPTNDFKNNPITNYAFGDVAEDYGNWLKNEVGIKEMPVYLTNTSDKPFARQMWFRGLVYSSGLGGGGLGDDCGVRGISEKTSEAGLQKILYSEKQISKALKGLGLSGLEKSLIASLK